MIINWIYENQNLLSLYLIFSLVGLRTYQHFRIYSHKYLIYSMEQGPGVA
jgi:hypothetical protein